MIPTQIVKALAAGQTVMYRVRILRGYLHGFRTLVFRPGDFPDATLLNVTHRLKCFRFDEKPYDQPTWSVSRTQEDK